MPNRNNFPVIFDRLKAILCIPNFIGQKATANFTGVDAISR
jgi:hypothetical protein